MHNADNEPITARQSNTGRADTVADTQEADVKATDASNEG